MFRGQVLPRNIQRNAKHLGMAFQLSVERTILRFRPRFNGIVGQSFGFVGDDQIEVEINSIAEALAPWTSAEWVVKRKEAGLGLLVADQAILAFEVLGKAERRCRSGISFARNVFENHFTGFTKRDLDAIHQTGTGFRLGSNNQPIYQYKDWLIEVNVE